MSYKIVNNWVPSSKYRIKATYPMTPLEICVHNTANTASARNEVAYMKRNNNMTSYHVAIDEREVVQSIPFNRNAWAAGDGSRGRGNRRAIHIEICYSMDNGYSGAYSARHRQAEENAALYIAHVLKQYGWGTDRLRQHWNYTGKDCPHKMRAHNGWSKFVNRVGEHLKALKGGSKPSTPSKPKPSNKNEWQTNKYGTQWKELKGVWINGGQPIEKRKDTPSRKAKSTGMMKPGQRLDYREIARNDGHIWLLDLKSDQWVPVKTWNAKSGKVGPDWGTWK